MYFSTPILLSLAATAIARPLESDPGSSVAGSKKNVYLATCTSRTLFDTTTSSVAIYYNGPVNRFSPSDIGVVSEPARRWEGESRRVDLISGRFTSSISADAAGLPKNSIAGTAKLEREEFVCFVDGTSTFQFREGILGLRSTNCKAEYWCASIST
ncbi:hypothetical protein GQ44DRAFT_611116 [Phaeosphaeriaceae sp. PMI808]|nr:hypothetical protein GQ44DRAFT_611116 [Phaeosphaeriaceae sp. PMI808]